MTIYEAPRLEPFAGSAPEDEIKTFEAWGRGLGIAFDETNGYPEMEGINGLLNTISKYILYLQQNGISEWKSGIIYPLGAGVRVGAKWYKAKRQNTNKTPENSQDDWLNLFDVLPDATITQKGIVQLVNDLTTGGTGKSLTAEQGKVLFNMFDNILEQTGRKYFPNPSDQSKPFILQWGRVNTDAYGFAYLVNPIVFPNAVLGGFANEAFAKSWNDSATKFATIWGMDFLQTTKSLSVACCSRISDGGAVVPSNESTGTIYVWGY